MRTGRTRSWQARYKGLEESRPPPPTASHDFPPLSAPASASRSSSGLWEPHRLRHHPERGIRRPQSARNDGQRGEYYPHVKSLPPLLSLFHAACRSPRPRQSRPPRPASHHRAHRLAGGDERGAFLAADAVPGGTARHGRHAARVWPGDGDDRIAKSATRCGAPSGGRVAFSTRTGPAGLCLRA